jgi:hypothetical protein
MVSVDTDGFTILQEEAKPDPKKLEYCGYQCPADCKMKKATLENNLELRKEAYKEWRIQEKYQMAFDPEKVFCWGCKTDKPAGIVTANCTVRSCVISKKYDSCIQCNNLAVCDEEIWKTFPQFRESMLKLQKKYLS